MAYTEAELLSLGQQRVLVLMYLGQQASGQGATPPTSTFGTVVTNAAIFVALATLPAKRVTFTNGTGTTLQIRPSGGGTAIDLPVNAVMALPTTANASEWSVARKDGGAAVTCTFNAENW